MKTSSSKQERRMMSKKMYQARIMIIMKQTMMVKINEHQAEL